jgi:hypothetical protein
VDHDKKPPRFSPFARFVVFIGIPVLIVWAFGVYAVFGGHVRM